jgi:hypothetical protein
LLLFIPRLELHTHSFTPFLEIKNLPLPEVAEFWARHNKVVGKARANLEAKELMIDSNTVGCSL